MGIGQFKQIKITRVASVKDGNGDNIETATDIYLGYAEVKEVSGSRRFSDMPINQKAMQFLIHNRPAIRPGINDLVEYDGRKHMIQNVEKSEQKRFYYKIVATSV